MLNTVLVMSIAGLLACAAGIAIVERLSRTRQPQVSPARRRRAF
jgi:hypothetical protein